MWEVVVRKKTVVSALLALTFKLKVNYDTD
jgi:hypothetical protein